jgi:serine/threonine protein kinase
MEDETGALAELDGFASPERALGSVALPMKRPTPSNREFVRPSSQRRSSSSSRDGAGKVDRKLPGSGASAASVTGGALGASEPLSRACAELPTPDCQAFQRLGQLRRRSHSSTPLGAGPQSLMKGATPSRAVCPPTPQRTGTARKGTAEVAAAAAAAAESSSAAAASSSATASAPTAGPTSTVRSLPVSASGTAFRALTATPTREWRSAQHAENVEVLFNAAASQPSLRFPGQKKRASLSPPGGKPKKVASSPSTSSCAGRGAGGGAGEGAGGGAGAASASAASRNEIPELRFVETIGAGTFATVSVVREARSGRLFALKENSKRFESRQAKSFLQYKRATLAWASLAPHPNVVPIYCAWVEPGFLRIQMELCRGGTLLHYVDWCMLEAGPYGSGSGRSSLSSMSTEPGGGGSGGGCGEEEASPWDEAQMWRCLGDAAAGLEQVHKAGLCHNDVKPSNMFLGGDGSPDSPRRVMIGDFGNLRRCHEQLEGDEGDFKYLSKDALEGGRATTAADVFSLGISFYEVVADVMLPEVGMWHQLREGLVPPLPPRNSLAQPQGLEPRPTLQPLQQQSHPHQQQQRRQHQQLQHHRLLFQPHKEPLAEQSEMEDQLYVLLCSMMDPRPHQRPSTADVLAHPMVQLHRSTPLHEYSLLFLDGIERPGAASRDRSLTPIAVSSGGTGVFVTTPLAESLKRDVGSFDARGVRSPVPSVQTALFFPLSRNVVTPESSPVQVLPPQQPPQPPHEEDPRRVLDFDDC